MKVRELIETLSTMDPNAMVLAGKAGDTSYGNVMVSKIEVPSEAISAVTIQGFDEHSYSAMRYEPRGFKHVPFMNESAATLKTRWGQS
jgi:hypothetical protein